jgi:hypothetical protein
MTMPTPTNEIPEENDCDDSGSVWPVVLAGGSVLLGYMLGRVSYSRDLRAALRRIEESPEPITLSIRTL